MKTILHALLLLLPLACIGVGIAHALGWGWGVAIVGVLMWVDLSRKSARSDAEAQK